MIINVPLTKLSGNPWQTRVGEPDAEYVKTLALDIAQNGLLQAPVGRLVTVEAGRMVNVAAHLLPRADVLEMKLHEGNDLMVQLAFGHRRLEAYKFLYHVRGAGNVTKGAMERAPEGSVIGLGEG